MKIQISDQLRKVAAEIIKERKSDDEWALIESDDMFQEGSLVGGYDATESAFCFSWYDEGKEFWFQVTLGEVEKIAKGEDVLIDGREAD